MRRPPCPPLPPPADELLLESALTLLPASDTQAEAFGPLVVRRWGDVLEQWLRSASDPGTALDSLTASVIPAIAGLRAKGYPARAEQYRLALQDAAGPARLAALPVAVPPLPKTEKPATAARHPAAVLAPVPLLPPQEIEARAGSLLEQAGALFTVQTRITAAGPASAQVTGVVWSTPRAERTFSFTFDVLTQTVSDIRAGGTQYPNSVPLERFTAWVEGK